MSVRILEIVSQVRALDSAHGLSEQTLQAIVAAVLAALESKQRHDTLLASELDARGFGGGDPALG